MKHYAYMVECKYGTYYAGYTNDIEKRIEAHNNGSGAKYLRGKGPVTLVFIKEFKNSKDALAEERRLKKLNRKKREELVSACGLKNDKNF